MIEILRFRRTFWTDSILITGLVSLKGSCRKLHLDDPQAKHRSTTNAMLQTASIYAHNVAYSIAHYAGKMWNFLGHSKYK